LKYAYIYSKSKQHFLEELKKKQKKAQVQLASQLNRNEDLNQFPSIQKRSKLQNSNLNRTNERYEDGPTVFVEELEA